MNKVSKGGIEFKRHKNKGRFFFMYPKEYQFDIEDIIALMQITVMLKESDSKTKSAE